MTPESSCFKLVADQFPLVSSLKWLEFKGESTLFGWYRSDVIVFQLTEEFCKNVQSPVAEPCAFEDRFDCSTYESDDILNFLEITYHLTRISLTDEVLDVVQWKNSIIVIDCRGNFHNLVNDNSSDAEDDIFDDAVLQTEVWRVNHVMKLKMNSIALACCLTSTGLAILHLTEGFISVSMVSFNPLPRVVSETKIRNYAQTKNRELFTKSILLFIPSYKIDQEILSSLLPSYEKPVSDEELLIVGLPNGIICCVTLSKTGLIPHFVLKWPFHPVAGFLSSSPLDGSGQKNRNSLHILFDGGTLAQFSDFSVNYSYIPLSRVKTGCLIGQSVVTSDFFETYVSRITGSDLTSYITPIKGAICFCPFLTTDSSLLTVTKHRTLYVLSLGAEVYQNAIHFSKTIPDETLFDQFVGYSQHLEQINQKIQSHDIYLNALSISMSADHLVFDFDVQIIAVYGNTHLLRVLLQNRMPELVLSCKTWHLIISLFSSSKCSTLVRNLENDLSPEKGLEDVFKFHLTGEDRHFTVCGRLIAITGSNEKYWPSFKVGEASLDIENYIQPISSLRTQEMLSTHVDDLIFESFASNVPEVSNLRNEHTPVEGLKENYSFRLFDVPSEGVILDLMSKSRALWRFSEWKNIGESGKIEVVIGRDKCSFLTTESDLQVCGSNVVKCYLLKLAMLRSLKRTKLTTPANENFLLEIDNILKQLEIHEFTQDNHSTDSLKDLFNRKEAFVMKYLTGSQSFLPTPGRTS